MATTLTKAVKRVTVNEHRGRRLVITLLPGDLIEIRESGRRTHEVISIGGVLDFAVQCRVSREQFLKRQKKHGR